MWLTWRGWYRIYWAGGRLHGDVYEWVWFDMMRLTRYRKRWNWPVWWWMRQAAVVVGVLSGCALFPTSPDGPGYRVRCKEVYISINRYATPPTVVIDSSRVGICERQSDGTYVWIGPTEQATRDPGPDVGFLREVIT